MFSGQSVYYFLFNRWKSGFFDFMEDEGEFLINAREGVSLKKFFNNLLWGRKEFLKGIGEDHYAQVNIKEVSVSLAIFCIVHQCILYL